MNLCVIARATETGLGYMSKDFCAAMRPSRTIVISAFEPEHPEWFADHNPVVVNAKHWKNADHIVASHLRAARKAGAEILVNFETYYNRRTPGIARELGYATVLFPNWECTQVWAAVADVMICLSAEDDRHFPSCLRTSWPAPDNLAPARPVAPPRRFVHNAGMADHNRNGTREVLQAAAWLTGTGARLFVRSQFEIPVEWVPLGAPIVFEDVGSIPREELYADADVLVHPMQFPGLSLPVIEAAAAGLPAIVLDLPEWSQAGWCWPHRVPVAGSHKRRFVGARVDMQEADITALGKLMAAMATGKVAPQPPPRPAGWREFKEFWNQEVCPRIRTMQSPQSAA